MATKVCNEQLIPPAKQRDLTLECVRARDSVSVIWTHLGTQLPFAYVHLVTFLINVNNLVMAVKCGIVFAAAIAAESYQKATNQVVFAIVVPLLYHGLLSISYIIHDPFGEDMLDFPVMAYQEYMNEAAVSIMNFVGQCPALDQPFGGTPRGATPTAGSAPPGIERCRSPSKEDILATQRKYETIVGQLEGQLKAKDDLVAQLQETNKSLERDVGALTARLQAVESRQAVLVQKPTSPTVEKPIDGCRSRWCEPPSWPKP